VSDQVRKIVADVLRIPEDRLPDDATRETVPEWTSLEHLRIIDELERACGISVSMDEVLALTSLAKLAERFGS
jgi:acyl carrier protein